MRLTTNYGYNILVSYAGRVEEFQSKALGPQLPQYILFLLLSSFPGW
jgi:hypothetical protein